LELDLPGEALALYDRQVWGVVKEYSQDQVNAVSLLARLELAGAGGGPGWGGRAAHLRPRAPDPGLAFLDLQYFFGLARAGAPEAYTLLRNIEAHAVQAPAAQRAIWQQVALPAARGLLAHARGDHPAVIDKLGAALPRLMEIGGSHAQRDLFAQIH